MHCKMCRPILSQHYKKKCWGKNSMTMVFKNVVFLVACWRYISAFSTNKHALLTRNVFSIEAVKVADIETKISVYVHEHDSCFKIHKLMQHQPEKKNHYFMFSPPLNYQINHPGHSYACNMSHDTDARSWLKNIL